MKLHRLFLILLTIAARLSHADAKPNHSAANHSGPDRTQSALAMHAFNLQRQPVPLTSLRPRAVKDQGNVSVVQDDGTLIIPQNRFDLSGRSVTFTPEGAGYQVQTGATAFDAGQGGGVPLPLDDDDSVSIALPFALKFYGSSYTTVFVNTDGNLTFGVPDREDSDRDLHHILQGPPRIAPAFDDFLPSSTGRVTLEKLTDRVIIDWLSISEYGFRARSTFQVVLQSTGVIQFNYQTMNITSAVVALSAGKGSALQLMDFSSQTTAAFVSGTVGEVFSASEQLDLAAISAAFYQTHQDAYDELIVFSDFDIDLEDAFAYEIPVRNEIQGIMPRYGTFDFSSDFGSARRLAGMVNAGFINQYPDNPREIFLGTNNTLEILGQEFGHRWLAYVDTAPSSMLGRDGAHWSFFMDTEGSVMEGNQIQDLGNGFFRTVGATFKYSQLDQYLMGLRSPAEVPPWFVVANPRLISAPPGFDCLPIDAACPPTIGVELSGTRRDLTINDVIAIAGTRIPNFESAQKDFSVAFVLVTKSGQEASPKSIAHLDAIREDWRNFFVTAVDGRGTMMTNLLYPAVTALNLSIATSGSAFVETAGTPALQVGYGALQSAVGVAVVRSFSAAELVSEAAVSATAAATHWVMYAEKGDRVATGVAIANPNATPANLSFTLSDGSRMSVQIPAKGQRAAFVNEFFSGLRAFLGTLTIDSDVGVAVVALRGSYNASGDFIITTIPVTSTAPASGGSSIFPMIADGGGYNTELILVNAGTAMSVGTIRLSSGSPIPFSIAAGDVWKFQTSGSPPDVVAGSATLTVDTGPLPAAVAVIRFSTSAGLVSETGFPAQRPISTGLTFGSSYVNLRTGFAFLNPSAAAVQVRLTARNGNGEIVGTPANVTLPPAARMSAFLDEILSGIPSGFDGTILMEASSPVYAIALRGTTVRSGGFIMAAVPIFDSSQTTPDISYFPQIVTGGAFTTEFLVGNALTGSAQLAFRDAAGDALAVAFQ
ncbi:MAG: hypothetical protein DMG14_09855 [Acidobacteria bacterium]|nr:MAG: hypothetical protein DMG14_09855 [Acidobacteriota bacterium]